MRQSTTSKILRRMRIVRAEPDRFIKMDKSFFGVPKVDVGPAEIMICISQTGVEPNGFLGRDHHQF